LPKKSSAKLGIFIAVIIIVLILVTVFIFFKPSSISSGDIEVKISYEGPWSASIATQINGRQSEERVSGNGTETYSYTLSRGDILSIIAQKEDGETGTLRIIIYDGGKEVKNVYTSEPNGLVATQYELERDITSTGDVEVTISYDGSWTAGIATQINGKQDAISVSGNGTENYSYTLSEGDIISIVAQKGDSGTGALRVVINDGDREIKNVYTTEPDGIVATKYEL